jgi:double-stranded uracil-DNA glycosylase
VSVKAGLPPIARGDARLFILGSLPGDASLAARQYYAHPTNQFWRLLGTAIGEELQPLPYEQRLERLADRRIGLWDVIAAATRRGSLDQAIRLAEHNQIEHLLRDFPDLSAIAFNGATAAAIGRKLIGEPPANLTLVELPSSSAANTRPFAAKAQGWSRLAQFVPPAQTAPHDSPARR